MFVLFKVLAFLNILNIFIFPHTSPTISSVPLLSSISPARIAILTNTIETSLRKMKMILSGNKRKINIIR